jgi:uncharacterized protein (TIGR03663 family)
VQGIPSDAQHSGPPAPATWSVPGWASAVLLVAVVALAFWLRTHLLAARPMHADEANQAVKFGALLEAGTYAYDPRDHHGPTLYYLTLPVAWARGQRTLAAVDETILRLLPALAGTLAVVLVWLLVRPLGGGVALAAALLFAVAPAAVYYSRYYIQETLLSTFMLGALVCGYRWWRRGAWGWMVGAGACGGLMLATKASAPAFWLATGAGLVAGGHLGGWWTRLRHAWGAVALAITIGLLVAAVFFSSFFTHAAGLRDAVAALATAWTRATGGSSGHEQPWWYYAELFLPRRSGGYLWDQSGFVALALAGAVAAWRIRRGLPRFVLGYLGLVAVFLSVVPAKTPWHVIHLLPALAVLAAWSGRWVEAARWPWRVGWWGLVAAVAAWQLGQTWRSAFVRPTDERNPLAYVHAGPDVLKARPLVDAVLAATPGGVVRVVSEEYWPLPWYLRGVPRVGYWTSVPADCDGAVVIASAGFAESVRARLHGAYREAYLGLRPGFVLVVFTRTDG